MAWAKGNKLGKQFAKGKPRLPNAGRKKGTPNKVTADVRATIKLIAERNVVGLEALIDRVAARDPAKAADLHIRLYEYLVPKLQRTEMSGLDGSTTVVQSTPTDGKL